MHKVGQSGGCLGRLLRPLLKTGLPLIGNVLEPLAKIFLIPLGLTAVALTTDAAIHKKMIGSGCPSDSALPVTTLVISNKEMDDIIKRAKRHLKNLVY